MEEGWKAETFEFISSPPMGGNLLRLPAFMGFLQVPGWVQIYNIEEHS